MASEVRFGRQHLEQEQGAQASRVATIRLNHEGMKALACVKVT